MPLFSSETGEGFDCSPLPLHILMIYRKYSIPVLLSLVVDCPPPPPFSVQTARKKAVRIHFFRPPYFFFLPPGFLQIYQIAPPPFPFFYG